MVIDEGFKGEGKGEGVLTFDLLIKFAHFVVVGKGSFEVTEDEKSGAEVAETIDFVPAVADFAVDVEGFIKLVDGGNEVAFEEMFDGEAIEATALAVAVVAEVAEIESLFIGVHGGGTVALVASGVADIDPSFDGDTVIVGGAGLGEGGVEVGGGFVVTAEASESDAPVEVGGGENMLVVVGGLGDNLGGEADGLGVVAGEFEVVGLAEVDFDLVIEGHFFAEEDEHLEVLGLLVTEAEGIGGGFEAEKPFVLGLFISFGGHFEGVAEMGEGLVVGEAGGGMLAGATVPFAGVVREVGLFVVVGDAGGVFIETAVGGADFAEPSGDLFMIESAVPFEDTFVSDIMEERVAEEEFSCIDESAVLALVDKFFFLELGKMLGTLVLGVEVGEGDVPKGAADDGGFLQGEALWGGEAVKAGLEDAE